jgi:peptide/nickel transport system permease protein
MKLWVYVARRLVLLVPVLLGVSVMTFFLSYYLGDPISAYVTPQMRPEQIEKIIAEKGFDQPIYVQYLLYLRDLLRGDWGISPTQANQPVTATIAELFPATFELTIVAILISLLVGIPLGIVSAVRHDKPADHASRLLSLSGVSIPVFWLALMMQYTFFYSLQQAGAPYLPQTGRVHSEVASYNPLQTITGLFLFDSLVTGNGAIFGDALLHIIMPATALAFVNMGVIVRITRSSMLEVLRQDYIILARSKGLSERIVVYRHALKNAMIPTVTVSGLTFGHLLGGAVLVEEVFAWPGLGRWAVKALLNFDQGAIMGFTLIAALIYVIVNLSVDVIYAYLDPRVRMG